MTARVAIVDYGVGNLHSAQKAFEHLGCPAVITSDAAVIDAARAVVLPGQGAFGTCMANLAQAELIEPVRRAARSGRPFLGICVGMQLLFEESEESPGVPGLGSSKAASCAFRARAASRFRTWDGTSFASAGPCRRWRGCRTATTCTSCIPTIPSHATRGSSPPPRVRREFVSSVARDSVYAGVFHPEKSQRVGLNLLAGFTAMLGTA
jgi:glutamine amidotransferase